MSQITTNTSLIIKEIHSTADIAEALIALGAIDADASGDNGDAYLWPIAKRKGFETNIEYMVNTVIQKPSAKASKRGVVGLADDLAKLWLKHDAYYTNLVIHVVKLNGYADDTDINGIYAFELVATDNN